VKYEIAIIGAGGHGREAADVIRDSGDDVLGYFADDYPGPSVNYLGKVEDILTKSYIYVIAIGDCKDKKSVFDKIKFSNCYPHQLIHPSAYIGSDCDIADGVMMYPGAKITNNVKLGLHVHMNVNSVASHDCSIGDFSIVSPGCLLNGNVTVGEGVFIGTGAIVLPKVKIGDWCIVGAGAVVTEDVPSNSTYVGVPARRIK